MKKINFFVTAMVIAMAANAANSYVKVTTAPTDWTGTYLIVSEKYGVIFNGAANEDNIDAKEGPAILSGFTLEGILEGDAQVDSAVFYIGASGNEDWPWYIKSFSGLYIGHKDTTDNGLSAETKLKKKCQQKLAIESGNFVATACSDSLTYTLQYNKDDDQLRFRYYKIGKKQSIQIYKLDTIATGVSNTSATTSTRAKKIIRDGQMRIVKDGQEYSILGL